MKNLNLSECYTIHGHTLPGSLEQARRLCGKHRIKDAFVDCGYRGHGYEGEVEVHICDGN